jgi:threonylcarbamoyladenosine tRNA methylthiotransferase MtaB
VQLWDRYPDFNLTTDIIVGFPGETEKDFQDTIQMAKDLRFSHIHTFKYSVRSGTRAERMDNHLTEKIKNQRSAVIRKISEKNKQLYFNQMMGKPQRMLIERISADGIARGYGENYLPLRVKANGLERNQFINVLPESIYQGKEIELWAKLL